MGPLTHTHTYVVPGLDPGTHAAGHDLSPMERHGNATQTRLRRGLPANRQTVRLSR